VPRLRGDEPDLALLGQFTRRGDLPPTSFTLKEFLLGIFPYWDCQSGLLDGGPEKNHNDNRASRPQSRLTLPWAPGLGLAGVRSTG
jgi:hypothetical protein